jgi:hypothetical protein
MILKSFKVLVFCLLLQCAQADDATWTSNRGLYVVSYQSELEPLQINQLHAWVLHIEDANGEPVSGAHIEASGGMPLHDHGLPTYPRVSDELGNGDYRLEGLRFHMRGDWELTVTIDVDGKSDVVLIGVTL